MTDITEEQAAVCARLGFPPVESPPSQMVGIARNVRDGILPLNGLRHPPENASTGWYIWAGEVFSQADDFFVPLHVAHLIDWCPEALDYLALPPGSRFLLAPNYEDVWTDLTLLDI